MFWPWCLFKCKIYAFNVTVFPCQLQFESKQPNGFVDFSPCLLVPISSHALLFQNWKGVSVGGVGREIEFNCSFNSSTTLSSPCVVLGFKKSSENPVLILLTRVPSWMRSFCMSSNLTLLGCWVELDPAGGWDLTLPNSCCVSISSFSNLSISLSWVFFSCSIDNSFCSINKLFFSILSILVSNLLNVSLSIVIVCGSDSAPPPIGGCPVSPLPPSPCPPRLDSPPVVPDGPGRLSPVGCGCWGGMWGSRWVRLRLFNSPPTRRFRSQR